MVKLAQLEVPNKDNLVKPQSVKDAEKIWTKEEEAVLNKVRRQDGIDGLIKSMRGEWRGGKED